MDASPKSKASIQITPKFIWMQKLYYARKSSVRRRGIFTWQQSMLVIKHWHGQFQQIYYCTYVRCFMFKKKGAGKRVGRINEDVNLILHRKMIMQIISWTEGCNRKRKKNSCRSFLQLLSIVLSKHKSTLVTEGWSYSNTGNALFQNHSQFI